MFPPSETEALLNQRPTSHTLTRGLPKHMKSGVLALKASAKDPLSISSYLPKNFSHHELPPVKRNMLVMRSRIHQAEGAPAIGTSNQDDDSDFDDADSVLFQHVQKASDLEPRSKSQQRLAKQFRMYATNDLQKWQRQREQHTSMERHQGSKRIDEARLKEIQNIYSVPMKGRRS